MKRLLIVGGGISGLAAAHAARLEYPELEIVLLEKSDNVGGKASTFQQDGWLVEGGPTGFLDNEPVIEQLIELAGMKEARLPANKASARRFLVRNGELREIQAHPLKFAKAGILSLGGMLRIAMEPFIRKKHSQDDESIFDFAARRLGSQAAERLIAPMVLGVFAGDAQKLSVASAFPKMTALEEQYGSLVKGMIARRKAGKTKGGPSGPAGWLTSFEGGMQSLISGLADSAEFECRCNAELKELTYGEDGWSAELANNEVLRADAVVLAIEPWAMAHVLKKSIPSTSETLMEIPCPSVRVVAMGFPLEATKKIPEGFGVLIPRNEGFHMLGCLWDSYLFKGRAPDGHILLRMMFGGAVDPSIANMSEEELLQIAKKELSRLFNIQQEPVFEKVVSWSKAIPQYTLGHAERVENIEKAVAEKPGLYLAGNGMYGVAYGRSAAAGFQAGQEAARQLK